MPVATARPDPNQLVRVRDRLWVVADVQRAGQHLVTLTSLEQLEVVAWQQVGVEDADEVTAGRPRGLEAQRRGPA